MPIIKNKSTIITTKLFKINKLDIEFDNQAIREYEVISGTGSGAVMIIPILGDNFLFIREYAAAINNYSLTFPKGKIDDGESILVAANRELQEEIGYKANKIRQIFSLNLAPGYMDHKTYIVLAENLVPSKLNGDEPEDLEVIKYNKNNLSNLLLESNNIDSRALASLYIYNQITNDNNS
ncbi:MAG: ADP compounds hydrolase NudE [Gammaproteobacteria bacterium]|jgi:ADP-ribose diphosphatase|nr:ADP compounds hydrolase NudE [Gammaproteobacteria bacterium]MBT5406162.1 ADP compounds hydrolase NudE [Gammaproteobacteria bacterium]MBT6733739.1 ADP compounds hydrolase NudE [Gammaproteobacteria bacterium]